MHTPSWGGQRSRTGLGEGHLFTLICPSLFLSQYSVVEENKVLKGNCQKREDKPDLISSTDPLRKYIWHIEQDGGGGGG